MVRHMPSLPLVVKGLDLLNPKEEYQRLSALVKVNKDLYTLYIENVNKYYVSDTIEFMLLTWQKDSFTPSQKTKPEMDTMLSCMDEVSDPFSKFTFTSDVDDLEKLPYVYAAMDQLKQRKKYWNE
ncbi:hypothetical protein GH714_029359 [Hevea brasiliensis]|uniref:Uncharacterized protein n=1 Tax=Hevea brasiliensis TaxID=3981 RepID=A0A6A6LK03_HEVBR|nr:hypothetical protein GH714_029359 [Hevea brasiliensis]